MMSSRCDFDGKTTANGEENLFAPDEDVETNSDDKQNKLNRKVHFWLL